MAKLKIGKLPVYKGEYQDDVNYSRLNLVSYLGTTFQSLTDDNIGHPPAELSEDGGEIIFINTNYWNIIAKGSEYNNNRVAVDSNKGYKILKKSKSFAEQVTEENTIYEIRYNFTLSENITIPANCVLKFDGGSISGTYELNLNNCQIEAQNTCVFKDIHLVGTNNDIFNLCWLINKDDITSIINSLPNTIEKITFNSDNTYYLSDTATFTNISYLDWNAKVYYNGNKTNISVLRIMDCISARINIDGSLSGKNSLIIDQINDNTNIIGLEIVNCQNSTFYITNVAYFNENIRISGLGKGCCNNKIFCGLSLCANRHIRIYQNDVDGNIGWTNENYFYGGHLQNYREWGNENKKSTAIHIEGGNDDNYNKVDALTFINFNVEGYGNHNGYTIYAKNVINSSFLRIRNEGGDYFMKAVGNCSNIDIDCTYGNDSIDISECSYNNPLSIRSAIITTSITVDLEKEIKKTNRTNYITSDILTNSFGDHTWYNSGTDFAGLAFNYNDVVNNVLYIKQTKGTVYISFVKDGNVVAVLPSNTNPFSLFDTKNGYVSYHYYDSILIPNGLDVDKVCVGIRSLTGTLTVSSYAKLFYDKRITPTIGAYANVPTEANDIPLGHEYYCTDLKKKIMWNGTAWVNLDGSILS